MTPNEFKVGDRVELHSEGGKRLAGTVVELGRRELLTDVMFVQPDAEYGFPVALPRFATELRRLPEGSEEK